MTSGDEYGSTSFGGSGATVTRSPVARKRYDVATDSLLISPVEPSEVMRKVVTASSSGRTSVRSGTGCVLKVGWAMLGRTGAEKVKIGVWPARWPGAKATAVKKTSAMPTATTVTAVIRTLERPGRSGRPASRP